MEVKVESVTRVECLNCKKLAKHCKCKSPNHKSVTHEYKTEISQAINANGAGQRVFESEAERLASIAKKFADKEAKRKERQDLSDQMSMDPEELADKKLKEELEGRRAPVQDEASNFVDLIEERKRELENAGVPQRDIMKAIKAYKRELRGLDGEVNVIEEDGETRPATEEEKDRIADMTIVSETEHTISLPDLDEEVDEQALSSPVKDPTTGKFVEEKDANLPVNKSTKRGRKAAQEK